MKERSISYSQGKGKLTHNDRSFTADNVDPERTKDNIVHKNESIAEAYETIFGDAQEKYNSKQKRRDRKIEDYFEKLFGVSADDKNATEIIENENKQRSFYEWVVGVGSAYDTGIVDWENSEGEKIEGNPEAAQIAKECLTEYIEGNPEAGTLSFQERNPNFYLFQAITHMDEKTPHTHIDVIPFSDGYKKGMTRQQGIAKALEAMGYGTGETSIAKWQETERAVFREICERHGLVIKDEEESRGYSVLTRQYGEFHENEIKLKKQKSEISKNDDQLAEQKLKIEESNRQLAAINAEIRRKEERGAKLDAENAALDSSIQARWDKEGAEMNKEWDKIDRAWDEVEERERVLDKREAFHAAVVEKSPEHNEIRARAEAARKRTVPVSAEYLERLERQKEIMERNKQDYDDRILEANRHARSRAAEKKGPRGK